MNTKAIIRAIHKLGWTNYLHTELRFRCHRTQHGELHSRAHCYAYDGERQRELVELTAEEVLAANVCDRGYCDRLTPSRHRHLDALENLVLLNKAIKSTQTAQEKGAELKVLNSRARLLREALAGVGAREQAELRLVGAEALANDLREQANRLIQGIETQGSTAETREATIQRYRDDHRLIGATCNETPTLLAVPKLGTLVRRLHDDMVSVSVARTPRSAVAIVPMWFALDFIAELGGSRPLQLSGTQVLACGDLLDPQRRERALSWLETVEPARVAGHPVPLLA